MVINVQSTHSDKKLVSNFVIEKVAGVYEMWHLTGCSTDDALMTLIIDDNNNHSPFYIDNNYFISTIYSMSPL